MMPMRMIFPFSMVPSSLGDERHKIRVRCDLDKGLRMGMGMGLALWAKEQAIVSKSYHVLPLCAMRLMWSLLAERRVLRYTLLPHTVLMCHSGFP